MPPLQLVVLLALLILFFPALLSTFLPSLGSGSFRLRRRRSLWSGILWGSILRRGRLWPLKLMRVIGVLIHLRGRRIPHRGLLLALTYLLLRLSSALLRHIIGLVRRSVSAGRWRRIPADLSLLAESPGRLLLPLIRLRLRWYTALLRHIVWLVLRRVVIYLFLLPESATRLLLPLIDLWLRRCATLLWHVIWLVRRSKFSSGLRHIPIYLPLLTELGKGSLLLLLLRLRSQLVQLLPSRNTTRLRGQNLLPSLKRNRRRRRSLFDHHLPVQYCLRRPDRRGRTRPNHALPHGSNWRAALNLHGLQLLLIDAHGSVGHGTRVHKRIV